MLRYRQALSRALGGHYWTLRPFASDQYRALFAASRRAATRGALRFAAAVPDARWGAVQIGGELDVPSGARDLLLCVHGLGGSAQSAYLARAVAAALSRGWACLRVDLRGADGGGEDFYHAALTDDLHAALASPAVAGFRRVYVLGYSLGGHLALRLASEAHDARVQAVAAVCAPIDLGRSVAAIDRPVSWPYRAYVLRQLKRCYVAVARRRALPTPLRRVLAARTLREWDACTVVPRYAFASVEDYYARASVAPRLGALGIPALLVCTELDPMVPAGSIRPALPSSAPRLDVRWLRSGGHVGFPLDADLGEAGPLGLELQVAGWLERAGSSAELGSSGSAAPR